MTVCDSMVFNDWCRHSLFYIGFLESSLLVLEKSKAQETGGRMSGHGQQDE